MIGGDREAASAPPRRLREQFGDLHDVGNRAGAIIRAVAVPPPLAPTVSARILASLPGTAVPRPGRARPPRLERLVFAGAALVALGASGVGAAAALDWIEIGWPAPEITPLPPPGRPALVPTTPPLLPGLPEAAPARRPVSGAAVAPAALALEPAKLAIDPRARGHRLNLSADFTRRHAGQEFAWQLDVCVSAAGAVSSARLVAPVHPQLDRRLLRAVAGWRYQPARLGGRAVRSCTKVVYRLTVEPATVRTD